MSTQKVDYMLLFRGTNWDKGLSPEQIQKVVSDWYAWFERLKEEGRCLGGHPLQNSGKMVSGKGGQVADGPFAESKEAIGGYFICKSRMRPKRWPSPASVRDCLMAPWSKCAR